MKFLEKDLEDIIFSADRELLAERGIEIEGKLLRQVKLGNYGVCDLLEVSRPTYYTSEESFDDISYHGSFDITIYELKKENVSISSLLQCIRYGKAIQSYFRQRGQDFNISFVLIGKTIDFNSDLIYLIDFMHNLSVYTYDYYFDGIKFKKHEEYKLVDEGFKFKKKL